MKCISRQIKEYEELAARLPADDFAWRVRTHRRSNDLSNPDPRIRLWARICERELVLRGKS